VWRRGEKLAAIGIKLNRSVVSHGLALNLTTDLSYFDGIVPCGHAELRPTSVEAITGDAIDTDTAAGSYASSFAAEFGVELHWVPPETVWAAAIVSPEVTPVRS
jgi:lipoyl(octanoyl) transferase